jgi:hypothetical protein
MEIKITHTRTNAEIVPENWNLESILNLPAKMTVRLKMSGPNIVMTSHFVRIKQGFILMHQTQKETKSLLLHVSFRALTLF